MADDMRRVVRQDETVVAGTPQQTVVTETPAVPVVPAAPVVTPEPVVPVAPVAQTTVTQTPVPNDRVVARNMSESVVDPAYERAATVAWIDRLVWFLVGVLDVLIAIRFVLLLAGANAAAGFAKLMYGVTEPFVAPFLGLFGQHLTYPGAAQTGFVEFESLVAIVVWTLIGWVLIKILDLALGTNHNRGTVVSDVNRRTRV